MIIIMEHLSEYEIRRNKVQILRDIGINPYAQKREKTHAIEQLKTITEHREIETILTKPQTNISIA